MTDKTATELATDFVEDLILPLAPGAKRSMAVAPETPAVKFNAGEPQTLLAGSGVISFVKGVTRERRKDIVNSSLLAQLAANKQVPDRKDLRAWHDAYFNVLTNLGWVIQERTFQRYCESGNDFEAEQAILGIAAQAFGGAATAIAIVRSTLDALKATANGKWITLFNRESQSAHAAKFQVTLVDADAGSNLIVYLMAFELNANAALTQVLFFKSRSNDIVFDHASSSIAINPDVLAAVREPIAQKVKAYVNDYVAAIEV